VKHAHLTAIAEVTLMSRPYWNDYQKTVTSTRNNCLWSLEDCAEMESILEEKGYDVWVTTGLMHDGQLVNKWEVNRDEIGLWIEELFKRRHIVEVEPHRGGKASIYFVCREYSDNILEWLHRVPKKRVMK